MRSAGLAVQVDPAGNVIGRCIGRRPELAEVWTGSHLDSVRDGGRCDGALGVVSAIEAAAQFSCQPPLARSVAVGVFRCEESAAWI